MKAGSMRFSKRHSRIRVDHRGFRCVQPPWCLVLMVTVLINGGCGDVPAVQQSVTPAPQNSVSDTGAMDDVSDRLAESIKTTSSSGTRDAPASSATGADDASESTGTASASQNGDAKSVQNRTSEDASPKPVHQSAEPTPEQLARWTQPEHQPLQLLACRESRDVGLVTNLVHTLDGRHFITAGTRVMLWSVESVVPEHVFLELTDDQTIRSLAVSPDGKWFAAGDSEGTLRIWSISDRRELSSKKLYSTGIIQIAVSPDSQEFATISYDQEITIWGIDNLQQKNRFQVETNGVGRIEYMTSELLVVAGETTTRWNIRSGTLEKTFPAGRYNFTMARLPDGSRFVTGSEGALQFWNAADGELESTLAGNFATEELVAFSADGKRLATANGSSVRLWDISSGQTVQIIDAFGWPITGMCWLPETDLLVVASENGRVRFWGTAKDGEALGMQPLHFAVSLPDGKSRLPATPAQMLRTMDLRTFPKLPESSMSAHEAFDLNCEVPVSIDEAQLFYRFQLRKAGWGEMAAGAAPGAMQFQKDGFMISASFYEGAQSKTSVNVSFGSNYDLRWAPKFEAAPIEMVFENENTVIYRTKAGLIQIETTLLRKMHAAGWTAYARLHASHDEPEDGRDLEFLQNGMTLRVSINRFPADPASYSVQYSRFLTTRSIPVPPDSGFVEFDGATQPFLVATTAMTLPETREFYDRELAAQGWLVRDDGRSLRDDHNWLVYISGQQDLTIGLQRLPTGRTLVRVGDELENSSWQLARPKEPDATDTTPAGIEAADFPILNESKLATFDAIGKSLEFSMDNMPLLDVGDRYTKELQSLGWQLDGSGVKSDDYLFLTFARDDVEIALRARANDGKSIVNIQGDGLLWTKELPGGGKVISYETWLRINHHPASLDLLDRYQAEMRLITEENLPAEKSE